eukprot:348414_1
MAWIILCVISFQAIAVLCQYCDKVAETQNYILIDCSPAKHQKKWLDAELHCMHEYGTGLAKVTSQQDNEELKTVLSVMDDGTGYAWIGINGNFWSPCVGICERPHCDAKSTINKTFTAENNDGFDLGGPNVFNSGNCVYVGLANGFWYDGTCVAARDFICNHPNGTYGNTTCCDENCTPPISFDTTDAEPIKEFILSPAGIACTIIVGCVIIGCIAWLLWWKYRKQKKQNKKTSMSIQQKFSELGRIVKGKK